MEHQSRVPQEHEHRPGNAPISSYARYQRVPDMRSVHRYKMFKFLDPFYPVS